MDFRSYPGESFEQFQHRLRRAQEEEELRRMHKSMLIPPSMLEMNGIDRISESHQEFSTKIEREVVEIGLQRTKQKNKILLLL